jgi:mono/diheme cytochrome c family protein
MTMNPFGTPPVCTSMQTWKEGNSPSPFMHPGRACLSCHGGGDGGIAFDGGPGQAAPLFVLGGTVYPTAHEPDECNGGVQMDQAVIVITDAGGQVLTLAANQVGNFFWAGPVMMPYTAKLVYEGCERIMASPQGTGDCNRCHTQDGDNGAPGRILLP